MLDITFRLRNVHAVVYYDYPFPLGYREMFNLHSIKSTIPLKKIDLLDIDLSVQQFIIC